MNQDASQVLAYHERTKHRPQRFAAGPETLDWDAQPDPFRQWHGSPRLRLPLVADALETTWAQLFERSLAVHHALSVESLACLLELSFGLTAWKQWGPDRWALRANPSSGNLHPTEVYVLVAGVPGLRDGLYHYAPRDHALELRATCEDRSAPHLPHVWVGLSSIQWREAWKYGERAFRYCQLDAGHALGSLRYAAAALGWHAGLCSQISHARLSALMGLDREAEFGAAEREEPEMLVHVGPDAMEGGVAPSVRLDAWFGQASRLDAHPMYRWPVINEVARATRRADAALAEALPSPLADHGRVMAPAQGARAGEAAATLIRGRRSAQHFDRRALMPLDAFVRILQAVHPTSAMPWDAWPLGVRVHPVLFVHRVDGLPAGVYAWPRSAAGEQALRAQLKGVAAWSAEPLMPGDVPLWRLAEHPTLAGTLRTLSCHQAIAGDACLALSLVAEFAAPLSRDACSYRDLYQEAGLIGQTLYLQAEAEGFRGTGMGCYFDDAVHELLGIDGQALQVLYHFAIGTPIVDGRITTEPPYAHLVAARAPQEGHPS